MIDFSSRNNAIEGSSIYALLTMCRNNIFLFNNHELLHFKVG